MFEYGPDNKPVEPRHHEVCFGVCRSISQKRSMPQDGRVASNNLANRCGLERVYGIPKARSTTPSSSLSCFLMLRVFAPGYRQVSVVPPFAAAVSGYRTKGTSPRASSLYPLLGAE